MSMKRVDSAFRLCASLAFFIASALLLCLETSSTLATPNAVAQPGFYSPKWERKPSVEAMTEAGRELFFDTALSASGKQSCASCHSPEHAYGPPNDLAVQLGGPHADTPGRRAVPSLKYLQAVPVFTEHFHDEDKGDDSEDAGPTGGLTWDGRADSLHEQARIPLLSPFEMANTSTLAVVQQIQHRPVGQRLKTLFGDHLFDDPVLAFDAIAMALEVFQQSPSDFFPYSSKYDAYLRKQAVLTEQESRGLKLFNAGDKGSCASCHTSTITQDGAFPQFTDDGLIALGVPRNPAIPANRNADYVDLGLCGPYRTDLKDKADYCGLFRTPTLRNIALRNVFFHNGRFKDIKDVLRFYVERDTHPEKWYPFAADGRSVQTFDDLPGRYRANINVDPPFDRHPGDAPALTELEMDDIISFLKTLTDGYVVKNQP